MFRSITRFAKLLFIAALLFLGWQWVKGYFSSSFNTPEEQTTEKIATKVGVSPFNALLVQQEAGGEKRILNCDKECTSQSAPEGAQGQALTNGTAWFYYVIAQDKQGNELTQLVTSAGSEKPKVIAAQTDLIRPKGLFLSPTGTKLVYFLDNIHEPEKKLTEVWMYDTTTGAVSVLAEKLHMPDMMTRLRWNSAGTRLWFVANSGTEKNAKIEFIVLNADNNTPRASFANLDWEALKDIADKGTMDLDSAGQRLAYGKPISPGFDKLVVTDPKGQQSSAAMPGSIPYVEWMPNGNVSYAVQDNVGFGFWQTQEGKATLIASERGVLRSARGDGAGEHIIFAADTGRDTPSLFVLSVKNKAIAEQQKIPSFGDYVFVVQAKPSSQVKSSAVAGITTELKDEEIAAFIDKNMVEITQDPKAQKTKFIATNEPNTVLLDYRDKNGAMRRLTVIIRDAIHPEWSIRARYQDVSGTWQKTEGGGVLDPKPLRLYEWEDSLNQWVLKEQYK